MTGFLTIEDANTANLDLINEFYLVDTSVFTDATYSNQMYDFIKISKSKSGDTRTYDLKIQNNLWTGGFYCTDSDNEYLSDITYNYDSTTEILSISCEYDDIKVFLYLCDFADSFNLDLMSLKFEEDMRMIPSPYYLNHRIAFQYEINDIADFGHEGLNVYWVNNEGELIFYDYVEFTNQDGEPLTEYDTHKYIIVSDSVAGVSAVLLSAYTGDVTLENILYLKVFSLKTAPEVAINGSDLYLGELNTINLGSNELTGYLLFNGVKSMIYEENNNYYVDLDLKEYQHNHVNFQLVLSENSIYKASVLDYNFHLDYRSINTAFDFVEMITSENNVVSVGSDITLTDDIVVTAPLKIIGNNHSIDLNGHSFILSEGVSFSAENVSFNVGDPAIIQGRNSKVNLDNVTFTNCTCSDYNNQGACILCDIDISSLDVADDYITTLTNCTFIDNHSCIVHGGELTLKNCKYHNTDLAYSDKNNVAFLYQVDGSADISGSVFDIDYTGTDYCINSESIGFAQALVKIGETASINGYNHNDFINNRFEFNNLCHLFCRYYYPKISSCVYSSPVPGKNAEAYCYTASKVNWVFKHNVQVTRADSGNENTYNSINWED